MTTDVRPPYPPDANENAVNGNTPASLDAANNGNGVTPQLSIPEEEEAVLSAAPDKTAPDKTAPDRTAPDRTAPDKNGF